VRNISHILLLSDGHGRVMSFRMWDANKPKLKNMRRQVVVVVVVVKNNNDHNGTGDSRGTLENSKRTMIRLLMIFLHLRCALRSWLLWRDIVGRAWLCSFGRSVSRSVSMRLFVVFGTCAAVRLHSLSSQ